MKTRILTFVLIATLTATCLAAGGPMTVKAVNKLSFSRPSQTIELSSKDLAPLGEKDLANPRQGRDWQRSALSGS